MKNDASQSFKDQVFISTSAWVIIVYAGIQLYLSVYHFLVYQKVIAFQVSMVEKNDLLPSAWSTGSLLNISEQLYLFSGGLAISAVLLIITAVGLLKRRIWGRILFTTIVTLLLALLIYFLFFFAKDYLAQYFKIIASFEIDQGAFADQARKMVKFQYRAFGVLALLIFWAIVRVTIKLNTTRVRAYFS